MNVPPVYGLFRRERRPDETYSIFGFASCLKIFVDPFHALIWVDNVVLLGNSVLGSGFFGRRPIELGQVCRIVLATMKPKLPDITLVGLFEELL
jgi:hypothetical protein